VEIIGYNENTEKFQVKYLHGNYPIKELSRIHICFDKENPFNFAKRIADAH